MFRTHFLWFYLFCFSAFTACNTHKKEISGTKELGFTNNYCSPTVPYLQGPAVWQDSPRVNLSHLPISEHDWLVCHILGISSQVDSLWQMSQRQIPYNINQFLLLKQKVTGRLLIAQSQLQAVAAELDCEGERSNLAALYLDDINSRKKNNLTVASIITGALTTVGTVIILHKTPQMVVGLSGGIISAGLGALTINPKGKRIKYNHERNLLSSVWLEPKTNSDYPSFVWCMLHEKKFSNQGNVTLSESIRERWLQFEFEGYISKAQKALFFGKGGYYDAADLHTRTEMINQLQATIRSIYQDLTGIITWVESK